MTSKWRWLFSLLTRRLWFRASIISLLAVLAALVSIAVSPIIPPGLAEVIGANSVDGILEIIASSMLAVTTFSLSTMVAAYAAATSNVTPRATRLLIEDTTTQNVLATFVGSFLYSLVAIITLSMGAYGERGRVVLFFVTLAVVLLIVVTLLRWIDYLLRLGRVGETTDVVEEATASAMRERRRTPFLGGRKLEVGSDVVPEGAHPIFADRIGYIQHVDTAAISRAAEAVGGRVYLASLPGTFIDPGRPIAWCAGFEMAPDFKTIVGAVTIADERSFDQDPRFGLCVLAEIASRALSPGINDPGTAIDVIGRTVRVLSIWAQEEDEVEPQFDNVWVPDLDIAELFDDAYAPIARDGAGTVEVQIRLQKALAILARIGDERFEMNARRHADQALQRVRAAMTFDIDRARVEAAATLVQA
jgi:uncharacterized membrane protein